MKRYSQFILLCSLIFGLVLAASTADTKRKRGGGVVIPFFVFGQTDDLNCIQDIKESEFLPSELCLAEYNIYNYFFAGISTTSNLLIAEKHGNGYMDVPTGNELALFQSAGALPNPLPTYSRPIIDYLYGYSLWLLFGVIALFWAVTTKIRTSTSKKNTRDAKVAFEAGLKRVLISAMIADGTIDEEEINTIKNVYASATSKTIDESEIKIISERLISEKPDGNSELKKQRQVLTVQGKLTLVRAAMMVLCSNERLDDGEITYLESIAKSLQISDYDLNWVVSEFVQIHDTQNDQQGTAAEV